MTLFNTNESILKVPDIKIQLEKTPKIAAIIITKDNTKLLFDAIDTLAQQNYPNIELHIADTGSNFDSKLKMKKKFAEYRANLSNPRLFVTYGHKYQYSKNNNDVVKNVSKDVEYLFFLNNDIKFINDNISQYIELFNSDTEEQIGTLGSQLLFINKTIQHQGIRLERSVKGFVTAGHINFGTFRYRYDLREVAGNTGAMLMIRKKLFEEIGGFDERFDLFQDVKLNLEAIRLGKKNIIVNSAISYHFESQTRKGDSKKDIIDQQKLQRDQLKMQGYYEDNYKYYKKYVYGFNL